MAKLILIVEDDAALQYAVTTKFKKMGCEVKAAVNGTEALRLLNEHEFDALLVDLNLPQKDGFGVLEGAKATKNGNKPTFVYTSIENPEYADRARKLGAQMCFIKSQVPLKDIVETVCKAVEKE